MEGRDERVAHIEYELRRLDVQVQRVQEQCERFEEHTEKRLDEHRTSTRRKLEDHEERIRTVEKMQWKMVGALCLATGLSAFIGALLRDVL